MSASLIHILWVDSEAHYGWTNPDDLSDALEVTHTVGILVRETETFVCVAHSFDPSSEEYNGIITIPRSAIEDFRTICQIKTK